MNSKGDVKLNLIITIVILVVGAIVFWKLSIPYYNNMKFEHGIVEILNVDYFREYPFQRDEEKIREEIYKLAQKLKIPVKYDKIVVEKNDQGKYTAHVKYSVNVNFPIYGNYQLKFEIYKVEKIE